MLAFMLKDELIELIEIKDRRMIEQIRIDPIEFDLIRLDYTIADYELLDQYKYEESLHKAKLKLAKEIVASDAIQVMTRELIEPEFAYRRQMTLFLRIQKPRN